MQINYSKDKDTTAPKPKWLIVIGGATASGKTSLGIQLAQYFDTSILSADSRQFYQEMNIGTAKPTAEELAAAPHHFINSLSIENEYSVGDFERDAIALLEVLFADRDIVIMVGGAGLYIKAICEGLDEFPTVAAGVREELMNIYAENGIEPLQEELQSCDPVYYNEVDLQNPHRLIRALEICRTTGQPFSDFRMAQSAQERSFNTIKIAIDWEREALYERINRRVELMLKEGLKKEALQLYSKKHLNALQTVGYQEWFDAFDGKYDEAEAIRLIKRNTRRYAKRQLTWFRKETDIQHFKPNELDMVIPYIKKRMAIK